ncbi:MAG: imidazole glycerol phosphate synthase subunit HisH [Lentisphaerae bacterium]|nr:imidazole glycerol phosphate synthase subunit HisH [Lentisphaerota bacterium]
MDRPPVVAIVDYGLGNLFSVGQACEHAGLQPTLASDAPALLKADAVILPGVGAFGDAMESLHRLDLTGPLKDTAAAGRPLIGICLGLQLLMSESHEFGRHAGLGLIAGSVVRFDKPQGPDRMLKVPEVGWNRIHRPPMAAGAPGARATERTGHQAELSAGGPGAPRAASAPSDDAQPGASDPWAGSLLEGLTEGEYMYFVHSFYAKPDAPGVALSVSTYGGIEFCSAVRQGSLCAFQFHPERSGAQGLRIYSNLAARLGVPPEKPL